MKSHTMNDIDTTPPHCHFNGRSGVAKSHPHGTESMVAGNLSAQGFHRAPSLYQPYRRVSAGDDAWAGALPSENFHVKKTAKK